MTNITSKEHHRHIIEYGTIQVWTTKVSILELGSGVDIFLKMNTSPVAAMPPWAVKTEMMLQYLTFGNFKRTTASTSPITWSALFQYSGASIRQHWQVTSRRP